MQKESTSELCTIFWPYLNEDDPTILLQHQPPPRRHEMKNQEAGRKEDRMTTAAGDNDIPLSSRRGRILQDRGQPVGISSSPSHFGVTLGTDSFSTTDGGRSRGQEEGIPCHTFPSSSPSVASLPSLSSITPPPSFVGGENRGGRVPSRAAPTPTYRTANEVMGGEWGYAWIVGWTLTGLNVVITTFLKDMTLNEAMERVEVLRRLGAYYYSSLVSPTAGFGPPTTTTSAIPLHTPVPAGGGRGSTTNSSTFVHQKGRKGGKENEAGNIFPLASPGRSASSSTFSKGTEGRSGRGRGNPVEQHGLRMGSHPLSSSSCSKRQYAFIEEEQEEEKKSIFSSAELFGYHPLFQHFTEYTKSHLHLLSSLQVLGVLYTTTFDPIAIAAAAAATTTSPTGETIRLFPHVESFSSSYRVRTHQQDIWLELRYQPHQYSTCGSSTSPKDRRPSPCSQMGTSSSSSPPPLPSHRFPTPFSYFSSSSSSFLSPATSGPCVLEVLCAGYRLPWCQLHVFRCDQREWLTQKVIPQTPNALYCHNHHDGSGGPHSHPVETVKMLWQGERPLAVRGATSVLEGVLLPLHMRREAGPKGLVDNMNTTNTASPSPSSSSLPSSRVSSPEHFSISTSAHANHSATTNNANPLHPSHSISGGMLRRGVLPIPRGGAEVYGRKISSQSSLLHHDVSSSSAAAAAETLMQLTSSGGGHAVPHHQHGRNTMTTATEAALRAAERRRMKRRVRKIREIEKNANQRREMEELQEVEAKLEKWKRMISRKRIGRGKRKQDDEYEEEEEEEEEKNGGAGERKRIGRTSILSKPSQLLSSEEESSSSLERTVARTRHPSYRSSMRRECRKTVNKEKCEIQLESGASLPPYHHSLPPTHYHGMPLRECTPASTSATTTTTTVGLRSTDEKIKHCHRLEDEDEDTNPAASTHHKVRSEVEKEKKRSPIRDTTSSTLLKAKRKGSPHKGEGCNASSETGKREDSLHLCSSTSSSSSRALFSESLEEGTTPTGEVRKSPSISATSGSFSHSRQPASFAHSYKPSSPIASSFVSSPSSCNSCTPRGASSSSSSWASTPVTSSASRLSGSFDSVLDLPEAMPEELVPRTFPSTSSSILASSGNHYPVSTTMTTVAPAVNSSVSSTPTSSTRTSSIIQKRRRSPHPPIQMRTPTDEVVVHDANDVLDAEREEDVEEGEGTGEGRRCLSSHLPDSSAGSALEKRRRGSGNPRSTQWEKEVYLREIRVMEVRGGPDESKPLLRDGDAGCRGREGEKCHHHRYRHPNGVLINESNNCTAQSHPTPLQIMQANHSPLVANTTTTTNNNNGSSSKGGVGRGREENLKGSVKGAMPYSAFYCSSSSPRVSSSTPLSSTPPNTYLAFQTPSLPFSLYNDALFGVNMLTHIMAYRRPFQVERLWVPPPSLSSSTSSSTSPRSLSSTSHGKHLQGRSGLSSSASSPSSEENNNNNSTGESGKIFGCFPPPRLAFRISSDSSEFSAMLLLSHVGAAVAMLLHFCNDDSNAQNDWNEHEEDAKHTHYYKRRENGTVNDDDDQEEEEEENNKVMQGIPSMGRRDSLSESANEYLVMQRRRNRAAEEKEKQRTCSTGNQEGEHSGDVQDVEKREGGYSSCTTCISTSLVHEKEETKHFVGTSPNLFAAPGRKENKTKNEMHSKGYRNDKQRRSSRWWLSLFSCLAFGQKGKDADRSFSFRDYFSFIHLLEWWYTIMWWWRVLCFNVLQVLVKLRSFSYLVQLLELRLREHLHFLSLTNGDLEVLLNILYQPEEMDCRGNQQRPVRKRREQELADWGSSDSSSVFVSAAVPTNNNSTNNSTGATTAAGGVDDNGDAEKRYRMRAGNPSSCFYFHRPHQPPPPPSTSPYYNPSFSGCIHPYVAKKHGLCCPLQEELPQSAFTPMICGLHPVLSHHRSTPSCFFYYSHYYYHLLHHANPPLQYYYSKIGRDEGNGMAHEHKKRSHYLEKMEEREKNVSCLSHPPHPSPFLPMSSSSLSFSEKMRCLFLLFFPIHDICRCHYIVRMMVDWLLGVGLYLWLAVGGPPMFDSMLQLSKFFLVDLHIHYLQWFEGWPAGLKLNEDLSVMLGCVTQTVIELWDSMMRWSPIPTPTGLPAVLHSSQLSWVIGFAPSFTFPSSSSSTTFFSSSSSSFGFSHPEWSSPASTMASTPTFPSSSSNAASPNTNFSALLSLSLSSEDLSQPSLPASTIFLSHLFRSTNYGTSATSSTTPAAGGGGSGIFALLNTVLAFLTGNRIYSLPDTCSASISNDYACFPAANLNRSSDTGTTFWSSVMTGGNTSVNSTFEMWWPGMMDRVGSGKVNSHAPMDAIFCFPTKMTDYSWVVGGYQVLLIFCVLGASCGLAWIADITVYVTVHIRLLHHGTAVLVYWAQFALRSLRSQFRGMRYNPLRDRTVPYEFQADQLLAAVILFAVLVFLMPTITVYYFYFSIIRISVWIVQEGIAAIAYGLMYLPVYPLGLLSWWWWRQQHFALPCYHWSSVLSSYASSLLSSVFSCIKWCWSWMSFCFFFFSSSISASSPCRSFRSSSPGSVGATSSSGHAGRDYDGEVPYCEVLEPSTSSTITGSRGNGGGITISHPVHTQPRTVELTIHPRPLPLSASLVVDFKIVCSLLLSPFTSSTTLRRILNGEVNVSLDHLSALIPHLLGHPEVPECVLPQKQKKGN